MKKTVIFLILLSAGCTAPLVHYTSYDGYMNPRMTVIELERNRNTSKIKIVFQKRGSPDENSFSVMMAFYNTAKRRNYEYFINLKEWDDTDGGRIYIIGFTNKKEVDIKWEFGEEYDYTDAAGQKRTYESVQMIEAIID
ncbi:MAG: hypothetical protein JW749_08135 [Sedimentisphaerales bacterium]|nr:hypothetical protein [Sedimentisphaerales bacterium]